MNRITRDCQKGGPPITASKCMIIMKICTSVTSILIRYRKPKNKKSTIIQSRFKSVICKLSSSPLPCTVEKIPKYCRKQEAKFINNLESKNMV